MLKEKVKHLPLLPGVYLMKDKHGSVNYVGKAKQLKNRVSSYFQQNKQHSTKVLRMVHTIVDFDFVVVDTELDALLLECELIQHYHPFYNRQMNYFTNYNYLQLTDTGFILSDEPTAQSFGPFRSYKKIPTILRILEETYQMPWLKEISLLALRTQLPTIAQLSFQQKKKEIEGLLKGRNKKVLTYLKQRQEHFIELLNFERASSIQSEIELMTYFIQQIQNQKTFLQTPRLILSLPVAADQELTKYYLICYGQLVATTKIAGNTPPNFHFAVGNDTLAKKQQLTKAEVDPVQILLSYQRKLSKEQSQ